MQLSVWGLEAKSLWRVCEVKLGRVDGRSRSEEHIFHVDITKACIGRCCPHASPNVRIAIPGPQLWQHVGSSMMARRRRHAPIMVIRHPGEVSHVRMAKSVIGIRTRIGGICTCNHSKRCIIYVADGVCPGTHGRIALSSRGIGHGIFADPCGPSGGCTARTFSPARSRRRWISHMEFLLVPQQQVPSSEASWAFIASERLLLGVRSLMPL